jgi:hypothetical protein
MHTNFRCNEVRNHVHLPCLCGSMSCCDTKRCIRDTCPKCTSLALLEWF